MHRGGVNGAPLPLLRSAAKAVVTLLVLVASPASAQLPQGLVYEWDAPRCVSPATEMARLIQDCIARVMYPRGLAGGEKPEVDVHDAALMCRRTRSVQDSKSMAGCVRALMYERSGLGTRRGAISSDTAAQACRYATNLPQAELVEECMKRLLFTRGGLGHERTAMTPAAAAYACQGAAAPPPAWPFQPVCRTPAGEEAVRFMEECIKRLLHHREGLGERREEMTPEAAALACEGAVSSWP